MKELEKRVKKAEEDIVKKTTVKDLKKFVNNIGSKYDKCEVHVWNINGNTYMPRLTYGCKTMDRPFHKCDDKDKIIIISESWRGVEA